MIDHVTSRVTSLAAAQRLYGRALCPAVEHSVERYEGRTQIRGSGGTFSLVEGAQTENLHLAFEARDRHAVDAFHRAGLGAGYASSGAPEERPAYHPGYYGAFLTDPNR